jgi:hypothetical protein
VRRSANGLADRITNEGVKNEGPELDTIWSNLPQGQFQANCTQLVENNWDNMSSMKDYSKNGGAIDTVGHVGPRQNLMAH